ncbi:MAG: hypothetical protein R3A44_42540 [Caldilineaceae bacterium]
MPQLPSYLLSVLRLKVEGYSNQAIAGELGYSLLTVETYVKRTIQFLRDSGLWDAHFSPRTGLMVCGKRYLAALDAPSLGDQYDVVTISPHHTNGMDSHGAEPRSESPLLTPDQVEADLRRITADPFEIGIREILLANHYYRDWHCTEAIPIFQRAEHLLGSATNLAAKAACSTAQMYIELGDLHSAKAKITAAQSTYESIADPEIRIEMQHINGWIDYSLGNLHQAKSWYCESLRLAAQSGIEHLAKHAHHFLGCIYRDWGTECQRERTAAHWFQRAEMHLDEAYRIHLDYGDDSDNGYDLFRKAQVHQWQKRFDDAKKLRTRARQLFGDDIYYHLSIDLEEAQITLKNHEERMALHKAEELLESWTDRKSTRGIADALRLMGEVHCVRGKIEEAFELYTAALCIYPYPHCAHNRKLWSRIAEVLRQSDQQKMHKQIGRMAEQIEEKQGPFRFLNQINVDRSADAAQILHKLSGLLY